MKIKSEDRASRPNDEIVDSRVNFKDIFETKTFYLN